MERPAGIKIRRLRIKDYKGIDELELNFPQPTMLDDPDIMVMGSRNGVGKTSVLECCVLLLQVLVIPKINNPEFVSIRVKIQGETDLIVRAGTDNAQIEGEIDLEGHTSTLLIEIFNSGAMSITKNPHGKDQLQDIIDASSDNIGDLISLDISFTPNPLLNKYLLYFHSFRMVQTGNPQLNELLKNEKNQSFYRFTKDAASIFKLQIIRSLMSKAELFETPANEQTEDTLLKLNELVERYANGRIEKLRQSENNAVEIRINPVDGGPSFTFDGLSSGQKEIISTLFLIWHQTRNNPKIVLIDEPELHLNPEWHQGFVWMLNKIAPDNQYIIATHSEDVFASVDKNRRLLLHDSAGSNS